MNLFARWLILSLLIIPITATSVCAQGSFLDKFRLNSFSDLSSTTSPSFEPSFDATFQDDDSFPSEASSFLDQMKELEPELQFDDPHISGDGEVETLTGRALLDDPTSLPEVEVGCVPAFENCDTPLIRYRTTCYQGTQVA